MTSGAQEKLREEATGEGLHVDTQTAMETVTNFPGSKGLWKESLGPPLTNEAPQASSFPNPVKVT